jgi:hypothetical protein
MERGDPIPPGIYWVDAFGPSRAAFADWASSHAAVRVLETQEDAGREWLWALFAVDAPTPRWPVSAGLGVPTIAEKGSATTVDDTVQKPDPAPLFPSPGSWSTGEKIAAVGVVLSALSLVILARRS